MCVLCFNQLCLLVNITCNLKKQLFCGTVPGATHALLLLPARLLKLRTFGRLSFIPQPLRIHTATSCPKNVNPQPRCTNINLCLLVDVILLDQLC